MSLIKLSVFFNAGEFFVGTRRRFAAAAEGRDVPPVYK